MSSQYDKLGEMLKDAIESGSFPKNKNDNIRNYNKNAENQKDNGKDDSLKKDENNKTSEEKHENLQKNNTKSNKKSNILVKNVQKSIHLYKIFNLNYGCTQEELKTSYHNLLKKYHPDNFNGFPEMQKIAKRKTQELIRAYNELIKIIQQEI